MPEHQAEMLAAIQYGRWLHECERGGERHLVLCVGGKTVTKDEMRLWFHTSDENAKAFPAAPVHG